MIRVTASFSFHEDDLTFLDLVSSCYRKRGLHDPNVHMISGLKYVRLPHVITKL